MVPVSIGDGSALHEAEEWVAASVRIDGPLEHVQTEPWGSVFRAASASRTVWFKACTPRQAFEVSLTAALSARWPTTVTEVLAHDVDRRWLRMADAGTPLADLGNPPARWNEVLPAYSQMQIGETPFALDHLDAGVPDLSLKRIPERLDDRFAVELPITREEAAALAAMHPTVASWCDELDDAGIGPTVQHDDLHMYNVYVKGKALRVLDWGDASISHPFFSLFETFRFLGTANGLNPEDPWFARLRDAYLEPWGSDLVEVFELSLRVAGFAHTIAWLGQREILTEADREDFDVGFAEILRLALQNASPSLVQRLARTAREPSLPC
jgi:hypothetical protein